MRWTPSDKLVQRAFAEIKADFGECTTDDEVKTWAVFRAVYAAVVETGELVPAHNHPTSDEGTSYCAVAEGMSAELTAARAVVEAAARVYANTHPDEFAPAMTQLEQQLRNYDAITNDTEQP